MFSPLIILGIVAAIAGLAWIFWPQVKNLFSDSETVLLARLQVIGGVLLMTDLSNVIPAQYLPWYVLASGVMTELARRSREPGMKINTGK